jgi:glycosyltransferase involved in cell wall biosynthesis
MKKMKIVTLITTFQKNEEEVVLLLSKNHIEGQPLVGDQNGESGVIKLPYDKGFFQLIMKSSTGISKNRNSLIKCAMGDVVTFADEEVVFDPGYLNIAEEAFLQNPRAQAIRFNLHSNFEEKNPLNVLENQRLRWPLYNQISCQGVFFRLDFLTNHGLSFDPLVGPGMRVSHGQDALFLEAFHKAGGAILQDKRFIGQIVESENTMTDEEADKYYYSVGYVSYRLYGKWAKSIGFFRLLSSEKRFKSSYPLKKRLRAFGLGVYDGKYY